MDRNREQKVFQFKNSYRNLPERFFARVLPVKPPEPQLVEFNQPLAKSLGLSTEGIAPSQIAQMLSGAILPDGAEPLAQAYAGHQFGRFVPQLGDGRAILLGELIDPRGKIWDLQLKGSGSTPFSRRGDGRATLGSVVREFLVSEAMYHLGIPTTRSLAIVRTGEVVPRDELWPGAVLTRVASSHLRVGTFEYFAARGDVEAVRLLSDYAISRHFPQIDGGSSPTKYAEFYLQVIRRQAELIAEWMSVGFVHGVMNTDNMTISGETIDFGPCAFLDEFRWSAVWSSIDRDGRYRYENQVQIAHWNLASLGHCLKSLIGEAAPFVDSFFDQFEAHWIQRMSLRLGLAARKGGDRDLILDWLRLLEQEQIDYNMSFQWLIGFLSESGERDYGRPDAFERLDFKDWLQRWQKRLEEECQDAADIIQKMRACNPIYIARNHLVERAIAGANRGDIEVFHQLLSVLREPFNERADLSEFKFGPKESERVTETFCGT